MFRSDATFFLNDHDRFQKKVIKQSNRGIICVFDNTLSPSLTIWSFKQMCACANCARKGLAVKNVTKFFSQWVGFLLTGSGEGRPFHERCVPIHILLACVIVCVLLLFLPFHWNCHSGKRSPNFAQCVFMGYMQIFWMSMALYMKENSWKSCEKSFEWWELLSLCQFQHDLISDLIFIAVSEIELFPCVFPSMQNYWRQVQNETSSL